MINQTVTGGAESSDLSEIVNENPSRNFGVK